MIKRGFYGFEDVDINKYRRDCKHEECPYKYCCHHKYWDGTEVYNLASSQRINIPNTKYGENVETCLSYMDV